MVPEPQAIGKSQDGVPPAESDTSNSHPNVHFDTRTFERARLAEQVTATSQHASDGAAVHEKRTHTSDEPKGGHGLDTVSECDPQAGPDVEVNVPPPQLQVNRPGFLRRLSSKIGGNVNVNTKSEV
jgi:hypothetical protein